MKKEKIIITLRDYILENYKLQVNRKVPIHIYNILKSYAADEVEIIKFKQHFNLNDCEFLVILDFILDGKNAYEIARFGNECHKFNHHYKTPSRKQSASDEYYSYGQGSFIKKFRYA